MAVVYAEHVRTDWTFRINIYHCIDWLINHWFHPSVPMGVPAHLQPQTALGQSFNLFLLLLLQPHHWYWTGPRDYSVNSFVVMILYFHWFHVLHAHCSHSLFKLWLESKKKPVKNCSNCINSFCWRKINNFFWYSKISVNIVCSCHKVTIYGLKCLSAYTHASVSTG